MAGSGGQVWPARDTETLSDQCPLGAGVCEVLKLKSLIRESSRYVFPAWWSLFFGAAGLDSGALFKCLLLFDLLTELHRGSSEWKHKIVQNQGNHIRTRQEKGKLFLDIFFHLFLGPLGPLVLALYVSKSVTLIDSDTLKPSLSSSGPDVSQAGVVQGVELVQVRCFVDINLVTANATKSKTIIYGHERVWKTVRIKTGQPP